MSLIDYKKLISESVKEAANEVTGDTDILNENMSPDSQDVLQEGYIVTPKKFAFSAEALSKQTLAAHDDIYKHYVDKLGLSSRQLDVVDRVEVDASHSAYRSIKQDETFNLNATYLHELYFANILDKYSEITMESLSFMRLERDFGTFDLWQQDFIACALSAREGWAVTGYNTFLRKFVNFFTDSHDVSIPLGTYPVIVIDMWAHSYYKDMLGDKRGYVINMMKTLNWVTIEERFKRAEFIAAAMK